MLDNYKKSNIQPDNPNDFWNSESYEGPNLHDAKPEWLKMEELIQQKQNNRSVFDDRTFIEPPCNILSNEPCAFNNSVFNNNY